MNIYRIWGVMFRHLILNFRNLLRVTDFIYWPLYDLLVWGLVGQWAQVSSQSNVFAAQLLIALILWHVTLRPIMEICIGFLEEIWSHNVFNLTTTSVTLTEWLVALMFLGIIKAILMLLMGGLFIKLIFGINILILGWYLFLFFPALMIAGWAIGLFAISLMVRYGKSIEHLAWALPWLFAPLSAVYIPLAAFPVTVAVIMRLSPLTYVFEVMRAIVSGSSYPAYYLWLSLGLGSLYFCLALCFFIFMLNKSRERGLARL